MVGERNLEKEKNTVNNNIMLYSFTLVCPDISMA